MIVQYALPFYINVLRPEIDKRESWDSMHYVDLCAGSGLTLCKPSVRDGQQVVKAARPKLVAGTALVAADEERRTAAAGKKAFDSYHFVEPHGASLAALRARVSKLVPNEKCTFYAGRGGATVAEVAERIKATSKNPHFLVVVDPDGLTEVTLTELESLLKLGRGDVIFNYQYMGLKRHPPSATEFFGTADWPKDGSDQDLKDYFHKRMARYGRDATAYFDVKAGGSRYAYEIAYSARMTQARSPWLVNYDKEISKRVSGLDSHDIENILFGQSTLF